MSAIVETDWGEIYTNYYDKIFNYIKRRVRYIDLCEELTHDVFIKAITADKKGIGSQSHFNGWLYRIAHNLIVDHYRFRDRLKESPLEYAENLYDDCGDPLDKVDTKIEFEKACAAIRQLTDDQQTVLLMRFLDGYEFDEIGQHMDRDRGAIKALQHRGLNRVNSILGGNGLKDTRNLNRLDGLIEVLKRNGPMTAVEVSQKAECSYSSAAVLMYRNPEIFVVIGGKKGQKKTINLWGLVGIHDKEAA